MALLGFLLLAAAVATAVSIAVSNTAAATFEVFGENVTDLSPGGLMLVGVGLGVAGLLGLWMFTAGMRRMRRRRATNRVETRETRSRVDELEEENIRLRKAAGHAAVAPVAHVAPTAMPTTSLTGSSTGSATGDRDGYVTGARDDDDDNPAERHATPMMATSPEPIDLRTNDEPVAYPRETFAAPDGTDTPDFDETNRRQEGRVFGRRNR